LAWLQKKSGQKKNRKRKSGLSFGLFKKLFVWKEMFLPFWSSFLLLKTNFTT